MARMPRRLAAGLAAALGPLVLASCLPPADGSSFTSLQTTRQAQVEYQRDPYQPPDLDGLWCFRDARGNVNRNLLKRVPQGLYAAPLGRPGRALTYAALDETLFQAGDMSYLFLSEDEALWRSNTQEIFLERCG